MAASSATSTARYPDLAGRVAIVTGGSKGIGAATCRQLAANGAAVAVVARGKEAVDTLVHELEATGARAVGVLADCADRASVEQMVASVTEALGPPDVCMAFAGGFHATTPILEIGDEEWRRVLDDNLTATFLTVQAVLRPMLERGRGSIVTMASNAARLLDIPLTASYAAAKAGVVMLTRHVAMEVGPRGVRVNAIAPATTLTERVARTLSPEALAHVESSAPLRRIGLPEDSASAALFLASDASSWLTGISIDVAGGRVMI
jgi:3-oxoacyl-[acyl-carrier protein] reductase